jgi:hypothetical protein
VLGLDAPEVLVEVVLHGALSPSTNQENISAFPHTNSGLYRTRTDADAEASSLTPAFSWKKRVGKVREGKDRR